MPIACTEPYIALHRTPPEKAAVVGVVVAVEVTVVTADAVCVVDGVVDSVDDAVVVNVVVGILVVDSVVECSVVVVLVVGATAHSATRLLTCACTKVLTMPAAELQSFGIAYKYVLKAHPTTSSSTLDNPMLNRAVLEIAEILAASPLQSFEPAATRTLAPPTRAHSTLTALPSEPSGHPSRASLIKTLCSRHNSSLLTPKPLTVP